MLVKSESPKIYSRRGQIATNFAVSYRTGIIEVSEIQGVGLLIANVNHCCVTLFCVDVEASEKRVRHKERRHQADQNRLSG